MRRQRGAAFLVKMAAVAVLASWLGPNESLAVNDCDDDMCGLNGAWLGSEYRFRTLNLDGSPNPQGLKILGFKKGTQKLRLQVEGDEVIGLDPQTKQILYRGTEVHGAELALGPDGSHPDRPPYTLHFEKVSRTRFWADCPAKVPACAHVPSFAWVYEFEVTSSKPERIQLCKAGLDKDNPNLEGKVIIFRGDLYDDQTFRVSLPKEVDRAYRTINFACIGTTISKLHLLRHTSASMSGSNGGVPAGQREALLRLLAADYCGIGRSFTKEGLPIGISPANTQLTFKYYTQTPQTTQDFALEAYWSETGARCLDTPRWGEVMWERIKKVCKSRTPPRCTAGAAPKSIFHFTSFAKKSP